MKRPTAGGPANVDEYLAKVPQAMRIALQRLRKTIRSSAPGAVEVISYGMPAFRHNGMLVFYAAFTDHCSFFVGSVTTQRKFATELAPFAVGKGTLRFTPEKPIPLPLVKRIVKARVAENEARARRRLSKTARKSSRHEKPTREP